MERERHICLFRIVFASVQFGCIHCTVQQSSRHLVLPVFQQSSRPLVLPVVGAMNRRELRYGIDWQPDSARVLF